MKYLLPLIYCICCAISAMAQQSDSTLSAADTLIKDGQVGALKKREKLNPYLQDTLLHPIPLSRTLFHDKIDNEQKKADVLDGLADNRISISGSEIKSAILTNALLKSIDRIQILVENLPQNKKDSTTTNQLKIQCLRGLWEVLRGFNYDPKPSPAYYKLLVNNTYDYIIAINENKALDYALANPTLYTLDGSKVILDNQSEARNFIYKYIGKKDPVYLLKRLEEFAKDTFASSIINDAALIEPKLVFNYALSTNLTLKSAIYRTKTPMVQAIVKLATESEAPLKALPFLSYLANNTKSIEDIDNIASQPDYSFNELVKLRISGESSTRALYTEELEYRTLKYYVRLMNELHDTTEQIRFQCIDSLPDVALYYLLVYGREEIYTSSFTGTFSRLINRMTPKKGNELLQQLGYDQFRTFIRLCAAYNTLGTLLATMDDTAKNNVMTRFINGLDKGNMNDLEDAVNVADAIGSIKDTTMLSFLKLKIAQNYASAQKSQNRKGTAVYKLLGLLAESAAGANADSIMKQTSQNGQMAPVTLIPVKTLGNDTGTVFERVFFYGDDDGKNAFAGFMDEYKRNSKWKVDTNKYWVTITSVTGKPVVLFANKPLKEPEDEIAIDSLDWHLRVNGVTPTVVVHRGHSYHVKSTLARLDSSSRLVILGSCGGYQNLTKVLQSSPDAHIISSKQTGVGAINEPIMRAINSTMQDGKDINWNTTWQELDGYFAKQTALYEKFNDYIPPHKNLGVMFIKAYRQMTGE